MNSQSTKVLGIAAIVVTALVLLVYRQSTSDIDVAQPAVSESGAMAPDALDIAEADGQQPEALEAEPLEPPPAPRNTKPLGENEAQKIRQQMVSQEGFPADVSMEQYKSKVWQDIQANPPVLVDRTSPGIDAEQAYRIYMYYGSCSVAPRTGAELDIRINQITARTQNADEQYLERVAQSADQTFDFYEFCSAIPEEVDARLEAVRWMSEAVYLGHPIAESQFYDKAKGFMLRPNQFTSGPPIVMIHDGLLDEFKSTARYALNRAVRKGHPESFLAMSQAHLDDIVFPRDPVLAMAYLRVAELEAMENRIFATRIHQLRTMITPLLNPDELAEADDIAHRIRLGENT